MKEVNEQELLQLQSEGKKILLDLYATWCGPCKMLMPMLESMQSKHPDAVFLKMDVDKNRDFAMNLGIRSVPTVTIYNGNDLVNKTTGVQQENFYAGILTSF